MPGELVWDAETGSQVKLGGKIKGTNISVYMKHPSTRIWCFAYSLDGAEPEIWKPGDPVPEAFRSADRFIAHNVEFERALWRHVLVPQYSFPPLPPSEKWFCTMAAAQMTGLVGGLKTIAEFLQLPHQKTDNAVMLRMMKPCAARPGEDPHGVHWNDDPEDFLALCEYCRGDVLCETALYQWLVRRWMNLSNPSYASLAS
jgi:hypothetical protein